MDGIGDGESTEARNEERTQWPKDKNTDRHGSRYTEGEGGLRPSGHAPLLTSAEAVATPTESLEPRRVGEGKMGREGQRRREDGGGGDKDGGTTLVIGSLAAVG